MSVKIKVCGITNPDDALRAVEAGVDAIGLVFFSKSPRAISSIQASEITKQLPPMVSSVGVFVNETIEKICKIRDECSLNILQLHGEESPELCQVLNVKTNIKMIKAFRIQPHFVLDIFSQYETDAWLLDAFSPNIRGGSGVVFDWNGIAKLRPFRRPIIIAGGLHPDNVAACIRATSPYGLDVSSGVEASPGKKDFVKMRDFVQAAREAALAFSSSGHCASSRSNP